MPEGPNEERQRRVDEAVGAYLEAVDAGSPPDPGEWLARRPDLRPELAEFLADQSRLDRLVAPLRASGIEGGATEGPRGFEDAGDPTVAGDPSTTPWDEAAGASADPS